MKYICLALLLVLSGCKLIKEMLPGTQVSKNAVLPENMVQYPVVTEALSIEMEYVPGYEEPHTPPAVEASEALSEFLLEVHGSVNLNQTGIIKVRAEGYEAHTVLILVPGIYSGAGTVLNLARAIVSRNPDMEVWAWERRANLLEDRRLFKKALLTGNSEIIRQALISGTYKPAAGSIFVPGIDEISFAGYWGYAVQSMDLYNVINKARAEGKKVILSGYSLGCLYVTAFLATEFTEKPGISVAGYTLVEKAVLFDGPPMIDSYIKKESEYLNGVYIFPPGNMIHGKQILENGEVYPCNTDGSGEIDVFFSIESKAVLARIAGDEVAPVMWSNNVYKLPQTNLAASMLVFDDNYSAFKLFSSTLGRAEARHAGVFSENGVAFIMGLAQGKKVISWQPPEQFSDEYNRIDTFLETVTSDLVNASEWYQPTKILLDLGCIHRNDTSSGWQSKYFRVSQNSKVNVPVFAAGLKRGLITHEERYLSYFASIASTDTQAVIIDKIMHFDGDTMEPFAKNPLADLVTGWIKRK